MIAIVALLVVVLILWGTTSISQSYAAAQQAKATIAAAHAAEVASLGNVIVIATLAILVLALVAAIGYLMYLRSQASRQRIPRGQGQGRQSLPTSAPAPDALTQLTQLMIIQTLRDMQRQEALPPHRALPLRDDVEDEAWR